MKISLNWISDYVELPKDRSASQIAHDLTMATVEVEAVIGAADLLADLLPENEPEAAGARVLSPGDCRPGQSPSDAIGLGDVILEIDNKSLTNRPDLWGHYGLARELAAIYGRPLKPLPDWEGGLPRASLLGEIDPASCNRFTAALISNVTSGPSPFWLQSRLWRVGQRPRNLFADLTNYVMLAVGQPCHAYDAERLSMPLSVRRAAAGERFQAVDGTVCHLDGSEMVVADSKSPVALAGVIGGSDSAITAGTRQVLLEAASFDALKVRRMSTSTGIRTEASSRFEKSLATQRIDDLHRLFFSILREVQPAAIVVGFEDRRLADTPNRTIQVRAEYLQRRIGKELSDAEIRTPLERLGLVVAADGDEFTVTVPDWRSTGDISGPHDLVEEIARLHGYESFPFRAPQVRLEQTVHDFSRLSERRAKEYLAFSCGMQEVINYPWPEARYLDAAGGEIGPGTLRLGALRAQDSDAEDAKLHGTLRESLVPGLLKSVAANLRWYANFRIFETGRVFHGTTVVSPDDPREKLPEQPKRLAAALVGTEGEVLFREAKGVIAALGHHAHVEPLDTQAGEPVAWADPGACVTIVTSSGAVGHLGVLSRRAARLAGIKRAHAVLFEIEFDRLVTQPSRENRYQRLPELPFVEVDVSLTYPDAVTWESIRRTVASVDSLIADVQFVDQYRGPGIPQGHRSITLRARLQSATKTLTSDEANAIGQAIRSTAQQVLGAVTRP